jgi:hypothetical protein
LGGRFWLAAGLAPAAQLVIVDSAGIEAAARPTLFKKSLRV